MLSAADDARACACQSALLSWLQTDQQRWRSRTSVGTVAACGFSGILYKVITSQTVLELLKSVISKAFHLSF